MYGRTKLEKYNLDYVIILCTKGYIYPAFVNLFSLKVHPRRQVWRSILPFSPQWRWLQHNSQWSQVIQPPSPLSFGRLVLQRWQCCPPMLCPAGECLSECTVDDSRVFQWYYLHAGLSFWILVQPIRAKLTHFGDYTPGKEDERKSDTARWWNISEKIRSILVSSVRDAIAKGLMSPEKEMDYITSGTEI